MSKVTLYMAISSDGFIADTDDKTPWSDEEWEAFQLFVKSCDCVLLGRRTYEIMRGQDEFVEGPEYIVVTNNSSLDTGNLKKISIASKKDIPNKDNIGVIGGGELNYQIAKLGIINEVILDEETVKLHNGIKLFGNHEAPFTMQLLKSKRIGPNTVQKFYKPVYPV